MIPHTCHVMFVPLFYLHSFTMIVSCLPLWLNGFSQSTSSLELEINVHEIALMGLLVSDRAQLNQSDHSK